MGVQLPVSTGLECRCNFLYYKCPTRALQRDHTAINRLFLLNPACHSSMHKPLRTVPLMRLHTTTDIQGQMKQSLGKRLQKHPWHRGSVDKVVSAHPCLIIFATSIMESIVGQAHSRYTRWQITASVHETALLWFAVPTTAWLQYLVQTLLSMRLELADRLCSAPQQTKQNSTAALQLHHS